jgi:hypothetical protein
MHCATITGSKTLYFSYMVLDCSGTAATDYEHYSFS